MNTQTFMKRFWLKQMFKKIIPQITISTKRFISIPSFLLLLISGLSLTSCKEELTNFGADLLPGSDKMPVDSVTISVTSNTIATDTSLIGQLFSYQGLGYSKIDYNVFGEYSDKLFGKSSFSILFEMSPVTHTALGDTVAPISLILYIAKSDSVILGSNDVQNFELYELNTAVNKDSLSKKYFRTNFDPSPYYDPNKKIETRSVAYLPSHDSIRFEITDASLINRLLTADSVRTDSVFSKYVFKGFYLKPKTFLNSGGISVLNLSSAKTYMELIYVKNNKDTLRTQYSVSFYPSGISTYTHDDGGSVSTSDLNHSYIEGLNGKYSAITLENLESLRQLGSIAINKAELVLTPDSDFLKNNGVTPKEYPKSIDIFLKGDTTYIDDISFGDNFYGGKLVNKAYHFNVTRYLQRFIKSSSDENLNQLVIKVRNSVSRASQGVFDAGRLAFKKNEGIILKIYYTKIK